MGFERARKLFGCEEKPRLIRETEDGGERKEIKKRKKNRTLNCGKVLGGIRRIYEFFFFFFLFFPPLSFLFFLQLYFTRLINKISF